MQAREAGAITQHIGATEVPIDHIYKVCGNLIGKKKFDVPGLLFIDTPGHPSFITLRARGGSLADIAVLVIDIREGLMPQTIESIKILRQYKTPFIIALNKIDTIQGWSCEEGRAFVLSERTQQEHTIAAFNEKLYSIIGDLSNEGIYADRYDRIEDFTKTVALVPISAKEGEGIPDLLLMLIGLAQRFLEQRLKQEEGPGRGTILEIKEEKGLGKTLDMILYSGVLKQGDTVALGTRGAPVITKIKAILKPKPLDEIMDPRDRFDRVKELHAAAGIKLSCQNMEGVIAGAPLRVVKNEKDPAISEMTEESSVKIELQDTGVMIKADAIGSLEALAFEAKAAGIPIRKYGMGELTRRDAVDKQDNPGFRDQHLQGCRGRAGESSRSEGVLQRCCLQINRGVPGMAGRHQEADRRRQEGGVPLPGQVQDHTQLRLPRQQARHRRNQGIGGTRPRES